MKKYTDTEELMKDLNAEFTVEELQNIVSQQQAEIEALKLQLHTTLTNRDLRTYDGKAQEK